MTDHTEHVNSLEDTCPCIGTPLEKECADAHCDNCVRAHYPALWESQQKLYEAFDQFVNDVDEDFFEDDDGNQD